MLKDTLDRSGRATQIPPERRLTTARIEELAALEHVIRVEPLVQQHGRAIFGDHSLYASFLSVPTEARAALADRIVAGEMLPPRDPRGVLVSEILLYQLGIVDEADVHKAIGRTLQFEVRLDHRPAPSFLLQMLTGSAGKVSVGEEDLLGKVLKRLPDSLDRLGLTPSEQKTVRGLLKLAGAKTTSVPTPEVRGEYTIRGVLRRASSAETRRRGGWLWRQTDLLLAPDAAQAFYLRLPGAAEEGFSQLAVEVDDPINVKTVQQRIRDMGLQADSAIDYIEREEFTYLVSFSAMSVVALIALMVAAIGITNTMLMSVLERVREIGVMKALGARDRHVLSIFLMEGALIGAVGSLLGLAVAWSISFPANAWLRSQVAERLKVELDGTLFAFPWWLIVGGPVFAVLVTTLAALYPARRAVRIDAVQALRHT